MRHYVTLTMVITSLENGADQHLIISSRLARGPWQCTVQSGGKYTPMSQKCVQCIIGCYFGEVFTAMSAPGHVYQALFLHLLILLNTDPDPEPCSCLLGKSLTSPSYNWVTVIVLLQTASYGIISLLQAVIISLDNHLAKVDGD